jgi:glycosyltransferase involved in cell wall biosynthesis
MTPLISFAVCTHNEGEYIETLLNQLLPFCKESGDEIVLVDDYSDDELTKTILIKALARAGQSGSGLNLKLAYHHLNKNFAAHKNYLNSLCTGKYIFQIDADETLAPELLDNLHDILNSNDIELYYVPRINIVNGLTQEDINRWGWKVNAKGHVMRPDYQTRLYKNTTDIKWEGKVHEQVTGFKSFSPLPDEEEYCIIHIKDISRQRLQNSFYETLGK